MQLTTLRSIHLLVVSGVLAAPGIADPGPGEIAASAGLGPSAAADSLYAPALATDAGTPAPPTPSNATDMSTPATQTPAASAALDLEQTAPGMPALAPDSASEKASKNGTEFRLGENAETGAPTNPIKPAPWYTKLFDQQLPIKFGMVAAEISSDNIFYQPIKTNDLITEISPFISLRLGNPISLIPQLDEETSYTDSDSGNTNFLSIDYKPTLFLYQRHSDLDVVDEYADAFYAHRFGKLTLSLEQKYQKLSQPTVQENAVGTLVNRDIYTTTAEASYIYSDKLSTYGTLNQTISDYKSNLYTNSNEWTGNYYFLYQLFPKLSIGAGPEIGFADIDKAPNQTYQRLLVHALYPASGKLAFTLVAGGEVREFEHNSNATEASPVFDAEARYLPFDSMSISLNAGRHRIVSNTQIGTDYNASTVSLQFRQRFFQVVYLTLLGGYEDDSYSGAVAGESTTRDDGYFYTSMGVEWSSKDWLTIDGSYQYSKDNSNISAFDFNNNEFKISVTLKY